MNPAPPVTRHLDPRKDSKGLEESWDDAMALLGCGEHVRRIEKDRFDEGEPQAVDREDHAKFSKNRQEG